ncbi:DUF1045 domain-containing protein [Pararhodobacter sp.]|uniref:DUF1045 domain-containing protein n=1 Tax=Pararhodobacter sp. TaxID=2127056 RepID=UPI002FDDCFE5
MNRFALYHAPLPGAFADAAAEWLGRDAATGACPAQPHADLPALTANARRYGFHATLKAPFRLAEGETEASLVQGVQDLVATLRPVLIERLELVLFGGFLALVPKGDTRALNSFAAQIVTGLDRFRAPLTAQERARRNPDALDTHKRALLDAWGYPYVLDAFNFHMTLSERLAPAQAEVLLPLARAHFAGVVPQPYLLSSVAVFGEDDAGVFHLRHRVSLA